MGIRGWSDLPHADDRQEPEMPTAQRTPPEEADRELALLARDWFEHDLQKRIDAAMEQQLAVFLAGEASRCDLARAA